MRCRSGNGNADIALLAMHKVFAQTLPKPADATIVAVIDTFVAIIVPKLAFRAVVIGSVFAATYAGLPGGLWC
jgi:2-methylisocitrate lyase-like PEP mutase family enzyme